MNVLPSLYRVSKSSHSRPEAALVENALLLGGEWDKSSTALTLQPRSASPDAPAERTAAPGCSSGMFRLSCSPRGRAVSVPTSVRSALSGTRLCVPVRGLQGSHPAG